MYFSSIIIIPLLAASTQAALNGHCSKDGSGQEGYTGICLYTSTCNAYAGGYYVDGLCPNDPSDIRCCFVDNCDPNTGGFIESYCDWTSHACPNQGSFHSGLCPGGSNFQCCEYLDE